MGEEPAFLRYGATGIVLSYILVNAAWDLRILFTAISVVLYRKFTTVECMGRRIPKGPLMAS